MFLPLIELNYNRTAAAAAAATLQYLRPARFMDWPGSLGLNLLCLDLELRHGMVYVGERQQNFARMNSLESIHSFVRYSWQLYTQTLDFLEVFFK